jgi:hypothetical protein
MIDFDGDTRCYYANTRDISNCPEFFDKFTGNLKVIKTCTGNALADGCIPEYNLFASAAGCNGYNQNNVNNVNTAYVLADGSIMIPYKEPGGMYPLFLMDINGFKGPNKRGTDLLSIAIYKQGGYYFGSSVSSCLIATGDAPFMFLNIEQLHN